MQHVVAAAQTVLYPYQKQMGVSNEKLAEISGDIAKTAMYFLEISRRYAGLEAAGRSLMWKLSEEQLIESIFLAKKFELEEEFIAYLIKELNSRMTSVVRQEEVKHSSEASVETSHCQ